MNNSLCTGERCLLCVHDVDTDLHDFYVILYVFGAHAFPLCSRLLAIDITQLLSLA